VVTYRGIDQLGELTNSMLQNDFIRRRQEGTGKWLLKSNEFQEWFKQSKLTLFCLGILGAGNLLLLRTSVLGFKMTQVLVLHLYIATFKGKIPKDLLASLLKHLVQEQPTSSCIRLMRASASPRPP
jgi:hypothetical protein